MLHKCLIVWQDVSGVTSKCAISSVTPVTLEESSCSFKSSNPRVSAQNGKHFRSSSTDEVTFTHNVAANCDVGGSEIWLNNHVSADLKSPFSEGEYGASVAHINFYAFEYV